MPKKRTTRKPHRNGLHVVAPHGATMPPHAALRSIQRDFTAWAVEEIQVADGSSVEELVADLTAVVGVAVDRAGLKNLFAWTPGQVTATLSAILDDDVLDLDDTDAAFRVASSLHTLLDHLADSDRWAASDGALEAADEAIHEVLEQYEDLLDDAGVPSPGELAAAAEMLSVLVAVERDPVAEDAALRALPAVADVEGLLRWLGPSRPVTSTDALRTADITGAAAAVGIDLAGARPRSMWDVPGLARVWMIAVEGDLVEVTGTRAVLTDEALAWLAADPDTPPVLLRDEPADPATTGRAAVAFGLVVHLLGQEAPSPLVPPPSTTLVPWLTAAAGGTPVPLDATEDKLTALLTDVSERDPDDAFPPERLAEVMATVGAVSARSVVGLMADEGVVRIDDATSTFTITPGLEYLVAAVVMMEIADDLGRGPEQVEAMPR